MLSTESCGIWRTVIVLTALIFIGGIALEYRRFSSDLSMLDSVSGAILFPVILLFQFRKRERWLWSAILSALSAGDAIKHFLRRVEENRWMFCIDVFFFVFFALFAVWEWVSVSEKGGHDSHSQ
jgi:hypothetical protein